MEQSKVPVSITYRKTGTSPPIFIAGSFSDPQWQLQEMDHSIDGDGEHTFKAQVMVEPDKEYQFKLRIGEGDWWILSDNYPTVTDDSGNQNNLLTAPRPSNNASTRGTEKGKAVDVSGRKQSQTSSKPEIVVATTDDSMGDADNLRTPLFAHECLGAYEFADASDHEEEQEQSRRSSRPKSKDFDVDFDVNDPTIEQFPSDRGSIMDALRNIQTHLSEDQTHLDDIPSSPRVVSSRRTSVDSIDEHSLSLSPAVLSPTTSRRRDGRLSHSSAGRNRSAVSLGSIAEEPKPHSQGDQKPQRIQPPEAKTKPTVADVKSPRSEDDEGVAMTTSEVTPNNQADEISPAQIQSIESKRNAPVNSESVQDEGGSAGMEAGSTVELDDSAAGVTSESADNITPRASQPKQDATSQESQIDRPSRSGSGKSPAKRSTTDVSIFRSLFSTLFGSKSNMILTTGVAALAIGIGWWRVIDKQVNKSGLL